MSMPTTVATTAAGTMHKRILKQLILRWKLHEFLQKVLPPVVGYSRMDLTPTSMGYRIVIYVKNPGPLLARKRRRLRELETLIKEYFGITITRLDVKAIDDPELDAQLVAEQIAREIGRGRPIRRLAYSWMARIMEKGALGVEIRIRGKLQKRRAKRLRFATGILLSSGEPAEKYVVVGKASILVKTGTIGVQVKIVLPNAELPDRIQVKEFSEVVGEIEKFRKRIEEKAREMLERLGVAEAPAIEEGEE